MPSVSELVASSRPKFDLTEAADQANLYKLTEALLALPDASEEIHAEAMKEGTPLEFKLAAKLVKSRRYMQTIDKPCKIAVVFAMWGEDSRLHPKSASNPNGEDALRVKLEQLAWATKGTPVEWTLYCVDDGCPRNSGGIAQEIANGHALKDRVKVCFLAKALPTSEGPLAPLASADDSRKGGAIIYGAMTALADGCDACIYTDADNSVHLGQLGLLLEPWQKENFQVVLGNRKHPEAVLVKVEGRWGIGIKVLRHMQRMIGNAVYSLDIKDTQAAFKLYDKNILAKVVEKPSVYDFSFDTDWILGAVAANLPFKQVPFAFIDSEAESASIAQGPMSTWYILLHGLLKAVRRHGVPTNEEMGRVLDEEIKSSKDLDAIINHLPKQLEGVDDKLLGDSALMSPADLQAWIKEKKAAA